MKKNTGIVSDVDSLITSQPVFRGLPTWFDRLPPSAQAELLLVKTKYNEGGYPCVSKRAIARAVISVANERGWAVSKAQGVISWLMQKPE